MLLSDQDSISRPYTPKKTPRPITARTHVSGMKALLPLKLSPSSSPELGFSSVRNPARRLTLSSRNPGNKRRLFPAIGNATNQAHRFNPVPLNVTSESYRDVPVYIDARSPLPGPVYYPTSSFWLDWSDSVSSSSDEDWDAESMSQKLEMSQMDSLRCGSMDIFGGAHDPFRSKRMAMSVEDAKTRDSELSFQCLGDKYHPDEASWLSTPALPGLPEHLPEILAKNMPLQRDVRSWLSETDSISDSEDSDLDSETESAPAIAAAVDVNAAHTSGRLVRIPPRSSSLTSVKSMIFDQYDDDKCFSESHDDETCFVESQDDQHPPTPGDEDSELPALHRPGTPFPKRYSHPTTLQRIEEDGMESWPFPPSSHQTNRGVAQPEMPCPEDSSTQSHNRPNPTAPQELVISIQRSMKEILSILMESISDLRSSLLLDYSPCIAALRSHLHPILPVDARYGSTVQSTASQDQVSNQPSQSPTPRTAAKSPSFAAVCLRAGPEDSRDLDSYDACSPSLDLAPLHRIFPSATSAMVLALYTHILAFILFAQSQSPNHPTSSSSSTARLSTISSISADIPSRVPSILKIGTPLERSKSHEDFIRDITYTCKLEDLADNLRRYISRLIKVMRLGSYNDYNGDDNDDIFGDPTNECFMQALIEVVTNCELQSTSA